MGSYFYVRKDDVSPSLTDEEMMLAAQVNGMTRAEQRFIQNVPAAIEGIAPAVVTRFIQRWGDLTGTSKNRNLRSEERFFSCVFARKGTFHESY